MILNVQFAGIVAGVLTSVSMLPQVIKTLKEKTAEDISPVMIIILISGIGCWIYYGLLRNDKPIIFTNAFSFLINILLLILRCKYSHKKK